MPALQHYGVGSIPWGPLATGRGFVSRAAHRLLTHFTVLCRPAAERNSTDRGRTLPGDGRGTFPSEVEIINRVEAVAKSKSVSMAEVAIAWSLQSPWVTAPIVGVRSTDRLDELIKGLDVELTEKEIQSIGEPYVPVPIRGHT